ncbi:hypothetical protein CAC42_7561 [Sphaceloma murrayae]|uniref:ribonuclease Z n=1 Tax=Sphaceloma murrayae TaxID=2082308 RepID=A0A2K1QT09_9PEZI|nr:hypothetical protein CAC42_7561 [Sphaceloma murrayae]
MKSYFQFLTTPTSDTKGTTLLVHFDRKRYLFGSAGEGLQRAVVQQGARVLKISEIFISGRTEWSNVGGLLGLVLVLADGASSSAAAIAEAVRAKVFGKTKSEDLSKDEHDRLRAQYQEKLDQEKASLTLYGPGNLNYMLATARRFIFRTSMPLVAHEVPAMSAERPSEDAGPATFLFKDDFIRVWGLSTPPLQPSAPFRNERKRSHEEMDDVADYSTSTTNGTNPSPSVLRQTESIVHEMFCSDWRIDRLFEFQLGHVKLPAKIFVKNPETRKIETYKGPLPDQPGYDPLTQVLIRNPWPGAVLAKRLPAPAPSPQSISYIVRTYPQRGKFDPKKAEALGLKDKSKWRLLTAGESLQNDKGDTISPDMVLEPPREATGFIVADLPTLDYVDPFLEQLSRIPDDIIGGIGAFTWILGPGVFDQTNLQAFMASKAGIQHMITAPDVCPDRITFDSASSATLKLHALDPTRYHKPFIRPSGKPKELAQNVLAADRGQMFQLEPVNKLSNDELTPPLDVSAVLNNVVPEAKTEADKAEQEIRDDPQLAAWASKVPDPNTEVITLGTGSALPSKYRNVSATLVRVPGWGNILLDSGENTVGQLRRMYSPSEFDAIMQDLRCIWVSHLHADHHLGTASVIKAWYQTVHSSTPRSPPLDVSSPSFNPVMHIHRSKGLIVMSDTAMLHWLWEYSQLEDFGFSHLIPVCVTPGTTKTGRNTLLNWFVPPTAPGTNAALSESVSSIRTRLAPFSLGFTDIQACAVSHCNNALAVSMTLPSGFKLSYSGDCRPSHRFTEIGKGTTLLVHEATFDDELRSDAVAKRHSTTGEALSVAAKMEAKAVVLTHFSQRYAKVPVIEYEEGEAQSTILEDDEGSGEGEDDLDDGQPTVGDKEGLEEGGLGKATFKLHANKDMKVCVAFDYMRVKVGDIAKMERYVPALLALYKGEELRREEEKKREKEAEELRKAAKGKGGKKQQRQEAGSGKTEGSNGKKGRPQQQRKSSEMDLDGEQTQR